MSVRKALTFHDGRQATAHGLDFRQFGHGRYPPKTSVNRNRIKPAQNLAFWRIPPEYPPDNDTGATPDFVTRGVTRGRTRRTAFPRLHINRTRFRSDVCQRLPIRNCAPKKLDRHAGKFRTIFGAAFTSSSKLCRSPALSRGYFDAEAAALLRRIASENAPDPDFG